MGESMFGIDSGFVLFFALMIGHDIADFPLQPAEMASGKNRNKPIDMSKVPLGQKPIRVWWHYLTAHALIHSGAVWLVTGMAWFALAEFVLHWVIDFAKCDNRTNPHQDQALHVACKVVYCIVIYGFLKG